MPSGGWRITGGLELLDAPISSAEFLVIDTETNGLAGDACEMTEVGAVLVGGGELHERFSSLVRTILPLRRGIQRFTGITQQMVDDAPGLEDVMPRVRSALEGRVMVAHNAPFDRRVLRQAFERSNLEWPDPPVHVHGPAGWLAAPAPARARPRGAGRRPRYRGRGRAPRAADAETCARVLCALHPRLCAHATTIARRSPCWRRGGRARSSAKAADRRQGGPTERRLLRAAARPGRLPVPRRPGPRSTSASRCRSAAGRGLTSRPRRRRLAGPSTPRSSTTGPPARSSGRWSWRTA